MTRNLKEGFYHESTKYRIKDKEEKEIQNNLHAYIFSGKKL